jgi:hypothetical protein
MTESGLEKVPGCFLSYIQIPTVSPIGVSNPERSVSTISKHERNFFMLDTTRGEVATFSLFVQTNDGIKYQIAIPEIPIFVIQHLLDMLWATDWQLFLVFSLQLEGGVYVRRLKYIDAGTLRYPLKGGCVIQLSEAST